MTTDQALLFALLAGILAMLLWGRVRHDLVAAAGLLVAVVLGLVPDRAAFSGFANPAVIVVALVLIASRAFENSGALGLVARLAAADRGVAAHVGIAGGIAAALSAVINNVAALAMLMPLDVQAARRAGRPPGITLMPLAFATILGGMVTLIGTPPNIIAASIRDQRLGAPYGMFDFTPVGAAVAIAGVLFVALVGWRLVPRRSDPPAAIDPASFHAELLVPEGAAIAGRVGAELDEEAEQADVLLVGLIRNGRRHPGPIRGATIRAGDLLVVEGSTGAIAEFIKALELQRAESDEGEDGGAEDDESKAVAGTAAGRERATKTAPQDAGEKEEGDKEEEEAEEKEPESRGPEIVEAVARADSPLVGRSAAAMQLRHRYAITLLGIARSGRIAREQVGDQRIAAGDELLITGRAASSPATLDQLGLVAVNRASIAGFEPRAAALAIGLFVAAIVAATVGFLSFTVAIAMAVAAYAALGLVPARDVYARIEWPVIVMLACLLPLGEAFDRVGGSALIADAIADLTAGQSPVVALVAVMVVTLTLSDLLNNVATMVITGPIAIDLAQRLGVNPDTFLMGVAISASCAFLTPIGHKNNTLIMGPGGFRFGDYWPMGLPLEAVVLVVAVPMLLIVWPL